MVANVDKEVHRESKVGKGKRSQNDSRFAKHGELTALLPLPRVCAPSSATASVQSKPILVRNTSSTCEHLDGMGRRVPDPTHEVASTLPQRKVDLRFRTLFGSIDV
jgi:hypothetical protein